MSIFASKNVWKFLIKRSADKIWSKKDKEIKVSPLMPIRGKELNLINKISLIIDTAAELLEAKNDIVNRNLLSKRHVNNFFY